MKKGGFTSRGSIFVLVTTIFFSACGGSGGNGGGAGGGTAPGTPNGLTVNPANQQVSLSWNASSGATSYHVKRSTTSGNGYSQVAAPTSTSYTDTGLSNGTTYYYVVSAVNAYGESGNSGEISAKPQAVAVAPTVTVTPDATTLPYAQSLAVTATVVGSGGTPTGTVALSSGNFSSPVLTLNGGSDTFFVLPGSLPVGSDTLTVTYAPDPSSSAQYSSSSGSAAITVTAAGNTSVAVNIDTLSNRHAISPFIYGNNEGDPSAIADVGYTFARWGGNDASNYNWKLQTRNSVADWFFETYGGAGDSVQFITNAHNAGSHALTTMPMMDWVAREAENSTNHNWSFSVTTFGAQCKVDPYNTDAGNGQQPDCKTPITTQPVTTAYYPLVDTAGDCTTGNCVNRDEWAQALAAAFGGGTCRVPYSSITSCHFYDMDNEPDIWNGTHRDVHPVPSGYDELTKVFEKEATNLKTWDASAVRFGPVFCCWWFYWNGANGADKSNHGGVDFLPWWLNQVYWLDQINGARTLDVFDIHAYADGGPTSGFNDQQLRAATVKAAKFYWDPATVNPDTNNTYTTNEEPNPGIPFVIPRSKAMANAIYPGTPLSFTEWGAGFAPNNGWDFSTAITDADTLGIFGREGLSFASRWGGPSTGTAEYQAWKMYTNYDGAHHQFGTLSISAQHNANPDLFNSYAALDSSGTVMTIMILNKDDSNSANVTFNLNGFNATTYTAYTLKSTSSSAIQALSPAPWSATQSFPPYSITLLLVSGSQTSKPASEWYLNPDDLMIPASGTGTLNPEITSGTAPVTLASAVFDSYEGAAACNGSLALTNPVITTTNPAVITVNAGTSPGFCHYTVTGNDGTVTQTEGGWVVVGNPAATLTRTTDPQGGTAGSTITLAATLAPGQSGGGAAGASVLFSTSAGSLQNVPVGSEQVFSGSKVLAITNNSGLATVTLALPGTSGTQVQVTAEGQYALGHPIVTFSEKTQ